MARDADTIPTDLPLPEYLEWALDRNSKQYEAQLRKGLFVSPLFEFVRCAKAHPQLEKLTAMEAFERLRALRWRDVFPASDDPETEFLATWAKVRVPVGKDILVLAASLAKEKPLQPTNCISPAYARYLSIAGRLQELRPGDYITLPVVRLGQILGVGERTISHYSALARKDGYLNPIAKHHALSHQAAKYTFYCERFNMETGEELTGKDSPHFHTHTLNCSKEYKKKNEDWRGPLLFRCAVYFIALALVLKPQSHTTPPSPDVPPLPQTLLRERMR